MALGIRPKAHDEQAVIDLQTEQLEIEQLKRHELLLRMLPEAQVTQILVALQAMQLVIEQL